MFKKLERFIISYTLVFLLITGTVSTFFFLQLEKETVSNKVAALLVERQRILNNLEVTNGLKTHYKSLIETKSQKPFVFFNSIYNE